jgi:hypothetical protein
LQGTTSQPGTVVNMMSRVFEIVEEDEEVGV